jgi:rifampicin phosphotransferase
MPSLNSTAASATPLDWSPPGPGHWSLDRSHYPGGTTLISQWLIETGMESGMRRVFAELGAPLATISARFVHGFNYSRTVPLVGANRSATKLPPAWVLKAATRLHPEFRRRTKSATKALANPPGSEAVRRWNEELRPSIKKRNDEFAAADLVALSDRELGAHCRALLDHLHSMFDLHFWLHGYDLGPIARFVAFTVSHGIPTAEAVVALAGASPSTVRPREHLAEIRAAVGTARPSNLTELRAVSTDVVVLLDTYLAEHGSTLVTGYDLTALTLSEMPETLFETVMRASSPANAEVHDTGMDAAKQLRTRVPETARAAFDSRLHEAREVMDMRDDNGPTLLGRPSGLLRLALLEVGRRLVARGSAARAEQALELGQSEIVPLLVDGHGPSAFELAERAAVRLAKSRLIPPNSLGPVEPVPPANLLPGPLAEFATAVQTAMTELGMLASDAVASPLSGTGIGTATYRGRARCSESPEQAIDEMEPGDVLVVRATSPAFNAVLSIAGAVVTADGGPLSHAAVLARELGIPAVVGAHGALDIPDGAMVEVDPVAGIVRILA